MLTCASALPHSDSKLAPAPHRDLVSLTSSSPRASSVSSEKNLGPFALAATLAALTMLGPFSIDTYLPAFPTIASSLDTSAVAVQQSLALYMFSFATMTLWHGSLSASFGLRKVILAALSVLRV